MEDKRLTRLLDGHFDGTLKAEERLELETLLRESEQARADFWAHAQLHGDLHGALRLPAAAAPEPRPTPLQRWRHLVPRPARRILAHAAVVATCLAFVWWARQPTEQSKPAQIYVAVIGHLNGVTASKNFHRGQAIATGELEIKSGLLELKFFNAATVTLQGPARLELRSMDRLVLHHGRLAARVPESATGFTVETPAGEIVDLGTEFGVNVRADGGMETHVFEGEVEVTLPRQSTRRLTAGTALNVSSAGAAQEAPASPAHFPRSLAQLNQLLINPGFEPGQPVYSYGIPHSPGRWSGDIAAITGPEMGIQPKTGRGMLRFDRSIHLLTEQDAEETHAASEQWQIIDLRPLKAGTPRAAFTAIARAHFNRIDAGADTDTRFEIGLYAYAGTPTDAHAHWKNHSRRLAGHFSGVNTDADPTTWQPAEARLRIPSNADFLLLRLYAVEDITDDSHQQTEFAGHYADAVQLTLQRAPLPATR